MATDDLVVALVGVAGTAAGAALAAFRERRLRAVGEDDANAKLRKQLFDELERVYTRMAGQETSIDKLRYDLDTCEQRCAGDRDRYESELAVLKRKVIGLEQRVEEKVVNP